MISLRGACLLGNFIQEIFVDTEHFSEMTNCRQIKQRWKTKSRARPRLSVPGARSESIFKEIKSK
jgi:hypothetical protein